MKRHKSQTDTTATHVAACGILVGSRTIQRCLVCGEKLADSNYPGAPAIFPEGEMVAAKLGFFCGTGKSYSDVGEHASLPRDFCISLVEL